MPSLHETFFDNQTFVVIGHDTERAFPRLTFGGLKKRGKTVYAVDPSLNDLDGEKVYSDLQSLPQPVQAAVLEVPPTETRSWLERVAEAGISDVWLHMNTETPEALEFVEQRGLRARTGTCAVQYVDDGFPHNVHRALRKLAGRW